MKVMSFLRLILLGCCASTVLFVQPVLAQMTSASLTGTIVDPSGALLPDVKISLWNVVTNSRRQTTTNKEGYFVLPQLSPGTYRLRGYRTGFAAIQIPSIVLNTSDQKEVRIVLKLGSASEQITVSASSVSIDQGTAIGMTIDRKFVESIPLNGQSFQNLLLLTPGVVQSADGGLSINGLRTNENYFTLDGVSVNVPTIISSGNTTNLGFLGDMPMLNVYGGTQAMVSVDALDQFNVQTATYSAEFGRQAGGQISLTSRSGTNAFHGSLYEYFRNDYFDAAWPTTSKTKKSPLRLDNYGGNIGGPLIHNRLFFFFDMPNNAFSQPAAYSYTLVPSDAMRAGTNQTTSTAYYYKTADTAHTTPIYFSYTEPFSKIPAGIQTMLKAFPKVNDGETTRSITDSTCAYAPGNTGTCTYYGLPSGIGYYTATIQNRTKSFGYSLKFDAPITSKLSMAFRYSPSHSNLAVYKSSNLTNTHQASNSYTTTARYIFSDRITDALSVNYTDNYGSSNFSFQDIDGTAVIPDVSAWGPTSILNARYTWSLAGLSAIQGHQTANTNRQWNVTDSLSWVKGAHYFTFGGDFRKIFPHVAGNPFTMGATFNSVTDLEASAANSISVGSQSQLVLVSHNYSLFAQDSWRARKTLTINAGVRWELNPAGHGTNPGDLRFVANWENPSSMYLAPAGTPAYKVPLTNFAPRAGIAYSPNTQPNWGTTFHGGFGLEFGLPPENPLAAAYQYPKNTTASYYAYNNAANMVYSNGSFPSAVYSLPTALVVAAPYPSGQTFYGTVDNFHLPLTMNWSAGLQQAFGPWQTLSINYVGNNNKYRPRQTSMYEDSSSSYTTHTFANANFPSAIVNLTRNDGNYGDYGNYNALQVQYAVHIANSLQAFANYTWAHAIDTNSSDYSLLYASHAEPALTRGDSDNDVRHNFNVAVVYELPKTSGFGNLWTPANAVVKSLANHWNITSTYKASTGLPFGVNVTRSLYPYDSGSLSLRADIVPGAQVYGIDPTHPGHRTINYAAFTAPSDCLTSNPLVCTDGNTMRNGYRSTGQWTADTGVRRTFPIWREMNLQFSAQAFNILNHPNYLLSTVAVGSISNTGVYTSTGGTDTTSLTGQKASNGVSSLAPIFQGGMPRSMQFTLKLAF